MPLPSAFSGTCLPWQNFYLLTGTAAATLIGLMFVAVTFGASLVTEESAAYARSFIDPTFGHFVHILMLACLMLVPGLRPWLLSTVLAASAGTRALRLVQVFRHMREAHRRSGDIELSDWLSGIAGPLTCHALLLAAAAGFVLGWSTALELLAAAILLLLLIGVYSAWETLVWMVLARSRKP
jgi:hypothetical protein